MNALYLRTLKGQADPCIKKLDKSFTMLFLARKLMRSSDFSNPTIVLITDRTDLDDQLSGQFTNAKGYIGDNNIIREHVTIHPGTEIGTKKTIIGNNGFFMVGCHVAHDCVVGNNVVFVNNAVIGGHVEISDFVYLGGHSAVHQFCRIGKHAIIGAGTTIDGDVIPFTSVVGSRGFLSGLNLVGLKRRSFSKDEIKTLRNVYRLLFAPEGTFNERLSEVKESYSNNLLIKDILNFLANNSNRPLVHPKTDKFQ